jgi:hypothetical protein
LVPGIPSGRPPNSDPSEAAGGVGKGGSSGSSALLPAVLASIGLLIIVAIVVIMLWRRRSRKAPDGLVYDVETEFREESNADDCGEDDETEDVPFVDADIGINLGELAEFVDFGEDVDEFFTASRRGNRENNE